MDQDAKGKLDLNQLRARLQEKPRTKAGQVRQAWPEIKALLDAGHSLTDICNWLNEIGIKIGYAKLSFYTSRLRRHNQVAVREVKPDDATRATVENDPLASIRERERQRPGFQFNSELDIKKLI